MEKRRLVMANRRFYISRIAFEPGQWLSVTGHRNPDDIASEDDLGPRMLNPQRQGYPPSSDGWDIPGAVVTFRRRSVLHR